MDTAAVSCCISRTDRREGAVNIAMAEGGSLLLDEQWMMDSHSLYFNILRGLGRAVNIVIDLAFNSDFSGVKFVGIGDCILIFRVH